MHCVKVEALRAIEEELTKLIVQQFGIKLDALFYDVTNFFTFIASTNVRPKLPRRGHSKQKRTDLRLFSLALLVSREGHIPLCSHLYEGNRVDVKSFPDSLALIRERLHKLAVDVEEITLVYDKGNLSKANQRLLDQAAFSYVALVHYEIDETALAQLETELYGKRILITDRNEWSDEQILLAYRGQSEVEEAFRQLTNG